MAKLISKTYGEALYEVAAESHSTTELLEEIRTLKKVLEENPDFSRLMLHPSIPKQDKLKVTEEVFRGRVSDPLVGFLLTVVEKERFAELEDIFAYYTDRVKEEQGIGVAYVSTPRELDEVTRKAVEEKLLATAGYKTLEMNYSVDESLIGGIVIRIGDRVADASVRTRLNDLTKQLLQIQLG